jgi:cAMP-dependent protein kinase regulator
MNEEIEDRNYINQKVNPILERLVIDLLINKPDDVGDFMINWLRERGSKGTQNQNSIGSAPLKQGGGNSSANSNFNSNQVSSGNKAGQGKKKVESEEEGSEDDEDDEYIEDLPQTKAQQKKGQRTSVSAEAYGLWNKKGTFKPRVIAKNDDQKKRINQRLTQAFMFSALDESERNIVIDAMEEKKFGPGEYIIKQGEDGNELYVVDDGQLDCFKKFAGESQPKYLKTYQPGESFGELALLYNAPRAATIQAKTNAILFALDREAFNNIVKDAAMKKREVYIDVLSKVQILETMDTYERSKIADALRPVTYKKGEYVIRQGDNGDTFYMIEAGSAVATKSEFSGGPEEQVFKYKEGDYFGELALLKNAPRAANIIATSDVLKLVSLDRLSFKRMMGPLEELLKRNVDKYNKYSG